MFKFLEVDFAECVVDCTNPLCYPTECRGVVEGINQCLLRVRHLTDTCSIITGAEPDLNFLCSHPMKPDFRIKGSVCCARL